MSDKNILSQAVPAVRHPDYKHEIAALLRGNLAPRQLQKQLEDYHEHDIAEALELLRRDERCRLYALLDALTSRVTVLESGDSGGSEPEEPTDPDFGDGMGDRGLVAGGEN